MLILGNIANCQDSYANKESTLTEDLSYTFRL